MRIGRKRKEYEKLGGADSRAEMQWVVWKIGTRLRIGHHSDSDTRPVCPDFSSWRALQSSPDFFYSVTENDGLVVSLGLIVGLVIGVACGRVVQSLLFEVKITDPGTLVWPLTILLGVAALASVPPAIRAVHVDPAETLRSE